MQALDDVDRCHSSFFFIKEELRMIPLEANASSAMIG